MENKNITESYKPKNLPKKITPEKLQLINNTILKLNSFFQSPLCDILFNNANINYFHINNPIIKLTNEKLKELNNQLFEYCKKSGCKNFDSLFMYNYLLNTGFFSKYNCLVNELEKYVDKVDFFIPKYPLITLTDIQNFFEGKGYFKQSIINKLCELFKINKIYNEFELYLIDVIKNYRKNELLYFGIDRNYNQFIIYAKEYIDEIKIKMFDLIQKNENQDILNKLKNQIANVLQCRNNEERKLIYNHCFKLQHERFKPIYDCMRVKKEYAENIINQFSIGRDDFKLATLDNLFFSGIFLTEPDIKLDIKQPEIENIQDVSAVNTTENNLNFNKQKNTINLRNFELDKWKNLIITLLDDRRIDIYINKKPHTQYTANYEELGFKMKKSNKPILSWYLFYLFKKNQALSLNIIDELNKKNLIDNSINYLTLRDNLKQYIKDFKKKLNQIFICKDEFEPISYDKKTKKYLLNFKIQ